MPPLSGGRRAHDIGAEHERLVLSCFDAPWIDLPPWLYSVRKAEPEEDAQGVDIIAETDVGDIGVQVKSSRRFLDRHEKRYPDVPVLVVRLGEAERHVRNRLKGLLKKIRKRRRADGVESRPMSDEPQMCLACNERPATSSGPVPLCTECENLAKSRQRGVDFQKKQASATT